MPRSSHDRPERIYRALLRLFPRAFRDRFGDDMTELFRDRLRATRRRANRHASGAWLAMFWLRTIADVLTQAAGEHLRRRDTPPRRAAHAPTDTHHKEGIMGTFLHDLPHAIKALLRQPGFLAVAVLTLALGIGANAAIFTVVHAVLIEALPYPQPERLLFMGEGAKGGGFGGASYPNVEDWRARTRTIEAMAVWTGQSVNLTGRAEPDRLRGAFVTGEFFDIIGLAPLLGRMLTPADDAPGAPRVTVLDYTAWQQRFAGDRGIVGRTLFLNNEPHTVVGVAEPGYWFPFGDAEVWLPARYHPSSVLARGTKQFAVLARMKPDVRIERVRAEMAAISRALSAEYPKENGDEQIVVEPMQELVVRGARSSLLMLLGAVGFVLLIGCVNLANLLLARGAVRHRELAVRAALGATRGRLFAHLLMESLLVAIAGGVVGLLIAAWAMPALVAGAQAVVPQLPSLTIRWPVIAFTFGLSLLTGLVFGTLPSIRLSRADLQARLRDGARGTDGRGSQRLRSGLVVAEIALSLMLLVGAGLLTRSLIVLLSESPGFNPDHVLSLEYRLPNNKYPTRADTWRVHEQMVARVRQVPGVTSAALVSALAFSGNGGSETFRLPDATDGGPATEYRALSYGITPEYFQAMGIPVLQGRACAEQDRQDTPRVVMINHHLAQRAWPRGSPIGARLVLSGDRTATIVGVVGNTKHRRLSDPLTPQIYGCFSQSSGIFATLVARTAVEPMSLERSVKAAIWSVDRDQPVWKVRTLQSLVDTNLAQRRYEMWMMVGTAAIALLLAIIGIYGVMSYMVNQRTREIGVRMALGAARGDIARLVVGRAFVLTVAGLILGLIGARLLTGVLSSMLFGVSATDAITYASVAALLTAVALLASYVPARRAMRVDPVRALRAD